MGVSGLFYLFSRMGGMLGEFLIEMSGLFDIFPR
jgi:hypothetical protein